MTRVPFIGSAAVAIFVGCAWAVAPADRQARVDAQGVMRWTDDGSEVAVFGVNYYAPFALDYRVLKERGHDIKATIRRDVAQFRRLGLNAIRLHCFDREFSTREGAFVDNEHVDALDYLIATCASNGLCSVLTPIAAWGGGKWTSSTNGFAYPVGIKTLTSDRALWKVEARFEREFAEHVNRYTGRRYADDPCVLCFELINEPGYPDGTTGEQIAEYANTLLAGIRASGTKKAVFYSATWNKHNECVPMLKTEGVSGVYYATGLQANHALAGSQLGRVRGSSLKADARLNGKAKIVYEFDAADTPGAYMYPAMARLFRSEGVQSATQFQYETTPLADDNVSYKTHYLNLIYTPEKALSFAIAAEVFRRSPRGAPFTADGQEMSFPPFRINAASNLSEMVTATDLLYTATDEHFWKTQTAAPKKTSSSGGLYGLANGGRRARGGGKRRQGGACARRLHPGTGTDPFAGAIPGGAGGRSAGMVGAAARSAGPEPEALATDIGRACGGRTREVPDAARMEFLRRRAGRPVQRERRLDGAGEGRPGASRLPLPRQELQGS